MQKMNFEIAAMLFERNASLGIKNKIGQIALDVVGYREHSDLAEFLGRFAREAKLSRASQELVDAKLKEIELQKVALALRHKWLEAQNNVLIDKERLKAFHKKISEKTKETADVLLTLPEKLDNSVEKVLNYSDGSDMDLSNVSDDDRNGIPFAEYENFLYDVPVDTFYNVG